MSIMQSNLRVLPQSFFDRDTLDVAKDLLGCFLVKKENNGILKIGKIVETEAYKANDPACHAYRGKTKRSSTLFKQAGIAYVYFTYGMHYCMNVVTDSVGIAGAVLIRALEPVENLDNTNGPAKLCKAMGITKDFNELFLCDSESTLFICKGENFEQNDIIQTTRIGIKVATDYPWRFYLKNNKWVSKRLRAEAESLCGGKD